jgi:hypothetical protein
LAKNQLPFILNWGRYQSKDVKAMDDDDLLHAAIADYTSQARNVEQPCIARSDVYELACGTYVILANVNRIQAVYRLNDDEQTLERITDLAAMQRIIDDYQVVYDEASLCH